MSFVFADLKLRPMSDGRDSWGYKLALMKGWRSNSWMWAFIIVILAGGIARFGTEFTQNVENYFYETALAGVSVKAVHFTGQQNSKIEVLEHALDTLHGQAILEINLGAVKNQIESMPWVKMVTVRRQLSGDIYIDIIERTPFALWQMDGQIWLIDEAGVKITTENLGHYGSLPFLVGSGAPQHFEALKAIMQQTPLLLEKVTSLIWVGERRWDIMFTSGARLRLPEAGPNYNPEKAWLRFAKLDKEHQLLSREVAIFDMRLPDRLILTMTEKGAKLPPLKGKKA